MELYLDTCEVESIKKLSGILNISGVTTNPSILAKSSKPYMDVIGSLCDVLDDDQKLFVQTLGEERGQILEEARSICSLRKNCYAKIPVTPEGLAAVKLAKKEGLGVLATAIYSARQGFLAAMNGADYLAPYVNRMCNWCDGVQEVSDLMKMIGKAGLKSKVIAASFKNVSQVNALLVEGIQAVTVPCDVAWNMIQHPGTQSAVEEFKQLWNSAYGQK